MILALLVLKIQYIKTIYIIILRTENFNQGALVLSKTKILLVEDDEIASYLMKEFLEGKGFSVTPVFTISDAISHLRLDKYNMLLLDLSLPDYSGFELLSNIKTSIAVPTIVISAYSETDIKIKAFKFGANDYVVKPVDFLELEARIWALLSRNENIVSIAETENLFTIKNDQILFQKNTLTLTGVEFDILSFLIDHAEKMVSREMLTESVASIGSHRLLDNHIKNIRRKIEKDSSKPQYLKTEYGLGYRLINPQNHNTVSL